MALYVWIKRRGTDFLEWIAGNLELGDIEFWLFAL